SLQNKQVEELLSLSYDSSTIIHDNLQEILSKQGEFIDIVLVATSSSLEKVSATISDCLRSGLDVISLCEELSYPFVRYPKLSKELDQLAYKENKTILGTGINPGFLMDLLPIVLTAPCPRVDRIHVTRCMDSSSRRAAFQKKIGTGMTPSEFEKKITEKIITGHVGLVESIQMTGAALGMDLDDTEEFLPEPVLANEEIKTPFTTVQKGEVRGLKSKAVGRKNGEVLITLDFWAYAGASPAYDEVKIEGLPNITQRIEGGLHGDYGTVGMVINAIPLVIEAQPGLLTMKDIPCPHNTQKVWKTN
ncbi:MAG: dihydrodipicolinate reductase, partial [Candidatus Hodarchaeota archaeon]